MANLGYLALVRKNRSFRSLWLAEVVSLTGDWFTTIALFTLLLRVTGRGEAVGFALVARLLPSILFGPIAGVVADRFSRRTILIVCDVGRAITVLGFLFVHDASHVWLVYALTFIQLTFTAFFETAEMAAIGSVVTREEIVAANTLQGITWSAMLALGALLGGVVTAWVGMTAAFWIDAFSYLLSAGFVTRAVIPAVPRDTTAAEVSWHQAGWASFRDGLLLIRDSAPIAHAIAAKAFWGLTAGGALMLYSVLGERVFPSGSGGSASMGLLYASRGLGALIGPVVARFTGEDSERNLELRITLSFWVAAAGYILCGFAPSLVWAALALIVAHMGVSTQWVFSTALINLRVPDAARGRAFATDMSLLTLGMIVSILTVGRLLDHHGVEPRALIAGVGVATVIPGIVWPWLGRRLRVRSPRTPVQ